ncbi:MAG: HPP family protein [Candidatus Muirbacterium halophilum]|nr:HPP family protein [Candidatus Muirbacterium halophilum]
MPLVDRRSKADYINKDRKRIKLSKVVDKKLSLYPWKYIFQCFLAMLTMLVVLSYLDFIEHTAIISSFGATSFITFTMPRRYHSDAKRLIGGYLTGIAVGVFFHHIARIPCVMANVCADHLSFALFGSIAVFFAILLMVILDTEHPPAAGIALGLVLNSFDINTIMFVIAAIVLITIVKNTLKPFMIDLL